MAGLEIPEDLDLSNLSDKRKSKIMITLLFHIHIIGVK